jgi:predicted secreted protein
MRSKQLNTLINAAIVTGILSTINPVFFSQSASAIATNPAKNLNVQKTILNALNHHNSKYLVATGGSNMTICKVSANNPSSEQTTQINSNNWAAEWAQGSYRGACNKTASGKHQVSVELFLAIDVSGSVDTNEYNLQKSGYVQAFKSQAIKDAIDRLPDGIAVAMQYWDSNPYSPISLNWRVIKTAEDAEAFANALNNTPRPGSGGTNIKSAVDSAKNFILNNRYEGRALVLDVSGDGISKNSSGCGAVNNVYPIDCQSLRDSRDSAVSAGITINGLPIVNPNPDAAASEILEDKVDLHYRDNVIGGVGAFFEKASGFEDFARAVAKKIQREIEEAEKRIQTTIDSTDTCGCTINGTSKKNSIATVKLSTANDNNFDVIYQANADAEGKWTLNLKTATPKTGTLPKLSNQPIKMIAVGVNGNESQAKTASFNNTPPTITNDDTTSSKTIDGTAVPNSNLTVKLDTNNDNTTDYTYKINADSQGKWTVKLLYDRPIKNKKLELSASGLTKVTVEDDCNSNGNPNRSTKIVKLNNNPD